MSEPDGAGPARSEVGGDTMLPFDDRGLAYGDGVFETVLVRDHRPTLWQAHHARLVHGCEVLGMCPPDREALEAAFAGAAGLKVTKLIVTRGSGGRGYLPPAQPKVRLRWRSTVFVPDAARWSAGVEVGLCRLRLARQPALAGIKHLNRLENVLARAEWRGEKIAEGLLADQQGWLTEATAMNLCWHDGRRWFTPPLEQCGVAGTLRAALLEAGSLEIAPLHLDELTRARALCLINSVQGLWPLRRLHFPTQREPFEPPLADAHLALQRSAHRLLGYHR
ncbi:aminodeoxychorismate lyase [Halotalea alkalilenta]|uniref:aminodeoxychorismate lyase n=1 Tax=Halotalea alkalilenta TaxID=376489 RepID=UPI001FE16287|nr:aminodeoxychorismate lyase [Halotalea alkalilenta]